MIRNALLFILVGFLVACASSNLRPSDEQRDIGKNLLTRAQKLLGAPYRYGGAGPISFDCSGLVQYVYKRAGLIVPRTVKRQFRKSRPVDLSRLIPGDVIFFKIRNKVDHVGIYVGNDHFIHAPSSGKRTISSRLSNPYWNKHVVRGGRFY